MIESAEGEMIAAPRPCAARAAMSWPSVAAKPAASEAMPTRSSPDMKTRRRPKRSAMRPPRSRKPPNVRTYALTTQARFSCENSRAVPIEGRATFTMDASRTTMNWEKHSRIRASQRRSAAVFESVILFLLPFWRLYWFRKLNSGSAI
jgi:hypothetical protein